jgi:thiol:disulfide interchange protein
MIKYFIFFILILLPFQLFADEIVIKSFTADWCSACQTMSKKVWEDKDVEKLFKDNKIKFEKLKFEDNRELFYKYKCRSLPTTIISKTDKEELELTRFGYKTKADFLDSLKKVLDKYEGKVIIKEEK